VPPIAAESEAVEITSPALNACPNVIGTLVCVDADKLIADNVVTTTGVTGIPEDDPDIAMVIGPSVDAIVPVAIEATTPAALIVIAPKVSAMDPVTGGLPLTRMPKLINL